MVFVSATRLRVRAWRFLPMFFIYAFLSSRQAARAPGSLRVWVLNEEDRVFWTCSLWESQAATRAFMTAGAHLRVMPRLMDWCDEASVAHWEQQEPEAPDWEVVHTRMQSEGRRSKVKHPSAAHQAFQIRPLRPQALRPVRFK